MATFQGAMHALLMVLGLLSSGGALAQTTLERALEAKASGDFATALPLWEELGNAGDRDAMIEAALIHHQGQGVPVDYDKAIDWYLKAQNGDALNNIGVMFRDGTGLPRNPEIAYLLFLTVHMTGMGNEATIMRANRNLRRAIDELSLEGKRRALCYTNDYLKAYVRSKGTLESIPAELRAAPGRPRIKEMDWWLEGEIEPYECPAGT